MLRFRLQRMRVEEQSIEEFIELIELKDFFALTRVYVDCEDASRTRGTELITCQSKILGLLNGWDSYISEYVGG